MPTIARHATGTFCWPELATTDPAGAAKFYENLFGWTMVALPIPGGVYTVARKGDHDVAALYRLIEGLREQGVPSNWLPYIATDDANQTVVKAKANGARVVIEPMNVKPDGIEVVSRIAVLRDPSGATFALWQAGSRSGAGLVNETGSQVWHELATHDVEGAKKFYGVMFGWTTREVDMGRAAYTMIRNEGGETGGIFALPKKGKAVPHWITYFAVDDADAHASRARALGGSVLVAPNDVPDVGRRAVLRDPHDAVFAVLQPGVR